MFPMQYFYQEYCLKTRDYLEEFDADFDEQLRRENESQRKVLHIQKVWKGTQCGVLAVLDYLSNRQNQNPPQFLTYGNLVLTC